MTASEITGEVIQFDKPYHSTVGLNRYLQENNCFVSGSEVLDIGTGLGANLHYFARSNRDVNFVGIDYDKTLIARGQALARDRGLKTANLEFADWLDMPESFIGRFDGLISIHALCTFKSIEAPLAAMCRLNPRWIAINSLFFDGELDVLIHIRDFSRPDIPDDRPDADFNIFSLPKLERFFRDCGYKMQARPFYPPMDIPKPDWGDRGTFTMKTAIHDRTQFSGPVYLPWHFVIATRV